MMTDAINTNNRIKAPNQPLEQRAKNSANASSGNATASPASAVVDLSSSKMLEQMEKLPEVDSSRIESIKTALANGEYQPNPEVIAQKFAEIESLLS
ncbi:MAG: flagellar biosynthesis anti-sigma factor FlgM [Gammaproteobacteria bacterium]|jgi:flagellar biosynthesis anti-sigma factor FlgM|nr:flagellar biosynthesis anti-sigma factor FlgM [Gammaproteobacteria bacterium]MBT4077829.1 flagellar biosynthesis anti-sigma factor FlgM [Gammaproteobacteria bacterium]MBT4450190.1 flagellar biosynthesis anti-sigma factor FlgM [Gammaproteobacteria bacterium]MBT4861312.1 flagellar biosynthesis anti-sigma factor FlgM [Gammaproteobacteria bacterium]MBT6552968.1 flagellar biosynthesis anti-sigma factor FlgM [Gammaproteobacteria bacterium]